MVLSMLSVIQNVSKHRKTGTESSPPNGAGDSSHPIAEMSRRKQRNPKPFFSSNDGETDEESNSASTNPSSKQEADFSGKREVDDGGGAESEGGGGQVPSEDEDRDSPRDLSSMVKVEVIEHPVSKSPGASPPRTTSSSSSFTPSPPIPSSGSSLGGLPPLTPMPPPPPHASSFMGRQPEEFASKNNMFHFGDVFVAHHPDTTPVPMVIPMVYLYPLPDKREGSSGGIRYRMLVPLTGGPPPPPPPELLLPPNMRLSSPPHPKSASRRVPQSSSSSSGSGSSAPPVKKESPLDLSKSPPGERGSPHLGLHHKELEAQLNFLKVKHLEFIKNQQQAAVAAAASPAASTSSSPSRCEECNINFSKHQNYIAHKKYYCSGGGGSAGPTPKVEVVSSSEEPVDNSRKAPVSSPKQRSAAAAAAAALGLLGISSTSPPRSSSNNSFDLCPSKDLLLLKQQQELINKELLMNKEALLTAAAVASSRDNNGETSLLPSGAGGPHFVCEGCGIKFKSVNNLQAHQARYCAGLRKAEEMNSAFEAMIKQQQQQQSQLPLPLGMSPADMMSFLNAKSMEVAAANTTKESKEDFCCILCGYKEDSVDKLKDHINMHFIGQVKRSRSSSVSSNRDPSTSNGGAGGENRSEGGSSSKSPEPDKKRIKLEESSLEKDSSSSNASPPPPPRAKSITPTSTPGRDSPSSSAAMRCDSCDIGFSQLSNFLAHKKYYCRGIRNASSP